MSRGEGSVLYNIDYFRHDVTVLKVEQGEGLRVVKLTLEIADNLLEASDNSLETADNLLLNSRQLVIITNEKVNR